MFCGKVKIFMLKGEKGDPGESGNYTELANKPQINGITLDGNKTASDLGIMTQTEAEMQRDAIAQFESEVQGDIDSFKTAVSEDVDDFKTDVNDEVAGFRSDLDILGARIKPQRIEVSDFVSSTRGVNVRSGSIIRSGNVINFLLNITAVEPDPISKLYKININDKYGIPIINGFQYVYIFGNDDWAPSYIAFIDNDGSIDFPASSVPAGTFGIIMGTYICKDIETYYESNPNAIIVQDGSVTWSKLADAVKTHGLMYSTTAPTVDNTDGGLKVVVLSSEPETRYNGYLYIIAED